MADDDEAATDLTGNRTSPLEATGGIRLGPPGPAENAAYVTLKPGEADDLNVPYRPAERIGRRTVPRVKVEHPRLACPNPRYNATARGYYTCPQCGQKAHPESYLSVSEWSYEVTDYWLGNLAEALGQVWEIARSVAIVAGQGIYWIYRRLIRKRTVNEDNGGNNGGVSPELVMMLATASMISAKYRGSGALIPKPAPELTVTQAKETEEIDH